MGKKGKKKDGITDAIDVLENFNLSAKTEELNDSDTTIAFLKEQLRNEKERNTQLLIEKERLSTEIEELTKALFEEANTLVASEAKERHQLVLAHKKLQVEYLNLSERLELESAQLGELRESLAQISISNSQVPNELRELHLKFNEDLFSVKVAAFAKGTVLWERVVSSVSKSGFDSFKNFINELPTLKNEETIFESSFMQSTFYEDILPCFKIPVRSKSLTKRIVVSLLSNNFHIERKISRLPSYSTFENAKSVEVLDKKKSGKQKSVPTSPLKLRTLMSNVSISVTSLPDNIMSTFDTKRGPKVDACKICSSQEGLIYRFNQEKNEEWHSLCELCREKLVAIANMLTFLRQIRQNVVNMKTCSLLELYLEFSQYKRACFYARSEGLESFYIYSDLVHLSKHFLLNKEI